MRKPDFFRASTVVVPGSVKNRLPVSASPVSLTVILRSRRRRTDERSMRRDCLQAMSCKEKAGKRNAVKNPMFTDVSLRST